MELRSHLTSALCSSTVQSGLMRWKRQKKLKHLTFQVRDRKVLGWEEIYKPEVCEEMAGWEDELHMHYEATRLSLSSCLGSFCFVQGGWHKIRLLGGQLPSLWPLLSFGKCNFKCSCISYNVKRCNSKCSCITMVILGRRNFRTSTGSGAWR